MKNILAYQVDKIMSDFNFEKTRKAMEAVGWKWAMLDGIWEGRVPTVKEIRAKAEKLLDEVANADHDTYITTCGFTVLRIGDDLQLLFILEEQGYDLHVEGVDFPGKRK
jgi:hypothetical protein